MRWVFHLILQPSFKKVKQTTYDPQMLLLCQKCKYSTFWHFETYSDVYKM